MAESIAIREELLVNHHVGSLKEQDVWRKLAHWDIKVGDVAILSTKNADQPWLIGDVLQVVEPVDASARLIGTNAKKGEHMIVIHERGYEKPHSGKEREKLQKSDAFDMYSTASVRDWKFDGKNLWRFQKQSASGHREDFYLKTATTQMKGYSLVRSTHSREAVAFWGPADKVLTGPNSGYKVLQKVLWHLSANPNVLWKQPAQKARNAGKKRKCPPDADSE